jgi:hypothetical protein
VANKRARTEDEINEAVESAVMMGLAMNEIIRRAIKDIGLTDEQFTQFKESVWRRSRDENAPKVYKDSLVSDLIIAGWLDCCEYDRTGRMSVNQDKIKAMYGRMEAVLGEVVAIVGQYHGQT